MAPCFCRGPAKNENFGESLELLTLPFGRNQPGFQKRLFLGIGPCLADESGLLVAKALAFGGSGFLSKADNSTYIKRYKYICMAEPNIGFGAFISLGETFCQQMVLSGLNMW